MAFRSREQLAACCQVLMGRVGLSSLWTARGPAESAVHALERDGQSFTSEQRMMLLACLSLWQGQGVMRMADFLSRLPRTEASEVAVLIDAAAHGPEAVDQWLAHFGSQRPEPHPAPS
ncbi:MAG: hypothetical protein HY901_28285 [Deltaproteobacteria bacterium]|nr:hypothetical protein [Deltaproteobacteria bacterium]